MATTIRTNDPREILALVPYQLGFTPQDSVVVVSIRTGGRAGLVARVDLTDLAHPEHGPRLGRSLVGHLLDDGAAEAVVVLYADGPASAREAAVTHLRVAAEHELGEPEAWVVCSTGYFGFDCTDGACCPPGGRPLGDLQGTQVSAQMVLDGVHLAAGRAELARIPQADQRSRKSAQRSRARWAARAGSTGGPVDGHPWRRAGLELWRAEVARAGRIQDEEAAGGGVAANVHGGEPVSPPAIGRLQAALDDVLVRDAVLLSMVSGAERVADRVVAGDAGADVGEALRAILDPARGRRPDPTTTAAARHVLELVVSHDTKAGHAPALTLLAVLAWWTGDGARAGALVDRALGARPGYRLAALLDDALRMGLPPGWVRTGQAGATSLRPIR